MKPGDGHPTPRAAGPTVWVQAPGGGTSVSQCVSTRSLRPTGKLGGMEKARSEKRSPSGTLRNTEMLTHLIARRSRARGGRGLT